MNFCLIFAENKLVFMISTIHASHENIDFLRNTPKVLFVAMHKELDSEWADCPVIYTGVGKARMTRAIIKYFVEHKELIDSGNAPLIVNIGTAGSGKYHRGDIVFCDSFVNNGDSFIIEKLDFDTFPVKENHICASSDFFISEKIFSKDIIDRMRTDYDCMDMESFALANICSTLGLKFCAIKCISDGCDDTVANFDEELPKFRAILNDFVGSLRP